MTYQLCQYDVVNATHTFNRAIDQFGPQAIETSSMAQLLVVTNHLKQHNFSEALKAAQSLADKHLVNMLAYLQIPRILRKYHTAIEKVKVDAVIKAGSQGTGVNATEFGFDECQTNPNVYSVDKSFGEVAAKEFRLDEGRLASLTKIVKFLETKNYKMEEKD